MLNKKKLNARTLVLSAEAHNQVSFLDINFVFLLHQLSSLLRNFIQKTKTHFALNILHVSAIQVDAQHAYIFICNAIYKTKPLSHKNKSMRSNTKSKKNN